MCIRDSQIALLGYHVADETAAPGDTLELTLFWQAQRPQLGDRHLLPALRQVAEHPAERNRGLDEGERIPSCLLYTSRCV